MGIMDGINTHIYAALSAAAGRCPPASLLCRMLIGATSKRTTVRDLWYNVSMATGHIVYQERAYLRRNGHRRLDETEWTTTPYRGTGQALVRDMTEIMTSFCARLYGRRSVRNRARRALEAAGD